MKMHTVRLMLLMTWVSSGLSAWGQSVPSKEPSSSHLFPAGGRRGTTVPVHVGAECLPPNSRFQLFGEGVSAPTSLGPRAKVRQEPSPRRNPGDANALTYPKEWESQVTIAPDAPLGPRMWRASCGWGGTQVLPFIVGE